jgi:hypothetical protein
MKRLSINVLLALLLGVTVAPAWPADHTGTALMQARLVEPSMAGAGRPMMEEQ